jgi:hypothetical protein
MHPPFVVFMAILAPFFNSWILNSNSCSFCNLNFVLVISGWILVATPPPSHLPHQYPRVLVLHCEYNQIIMGIEKLLVNKQNILKNIQPNWFDKKNKSTNKLFFFDFYLCCCCC